MIKQKKVKIMPNQKSNHQIEDKYETTKAQRSQRIKKNISSNGFLCVLCAFVVKVIIL